MINVPKFANETEEADWWYDNRERHGDEFAAAFHAGQVRRGSGIVQYLAQLEKARALLPNREDAVHLARLAFKKGVDVEAYLQELVHKAIMQELDPAA
jgi:hypothetical protein